MSLRRERQIHVFTARMPVDEYEALRSYAFFAGRSVNEVVVAAIRDFLTTHATDDLLDAMVEEKRTTFRRTLERLGDSDRQQAGAGEEVAQ